MEILSKNHFALLTERTLADWISLLTFIPILGAYQAILTNRPDWAIFLFVIAFYLDTLDGFTARKQKTESTFGRQLDTFADFANYVLGSCLFIYIFLPLALPVKYFAIFLFVIAGILRLCRMTLVGIALLPQTKQPFYHGLPVTFISLFAFIFFYVFQTPSLLLNIFFCFVTIIMSILMISEMPVRKLPSRFWIIISLPILWIATWNLLS